MPPQAEPSSVATAVRDADEVIRTDQLTKIYPGNILAVELLAAAEGIEFHRPLKSSAALETAHAALRARVPRFDRDRMMSPAIAAASAAVCMRRRVE